MNKALSLWGGKTSERANMILEGRKAVDIGQFFAAYQENLKLQQALRGVLDGTVYSNRLPDIQDILKSGASPKVIYLDALRRFGRKDGQEIYRLIKNCSNF